MSCWSLEQERCQEDLLEVERDVHHLSLAPELQGSGTSTIFLVGTGYGSLLLTLMLHFKEVHVVAVERDPFLFSLVTSSVTENGLQERFLLQTSGSNLVDAAPTGSVDLVLFKCGGCEWQALQEPGWATLKARTRRVAGDVWYTEQNTATFASTRRPKESNDVFHFARGLDVAVLLESQPRPTVPTRVGRQLWASILAEAPAGAAPRWSQAARVRLRRPADLCLRLASEISCRAA